MTVSVKNQGVWYKNRSAVTAASESFSKTKQNVHFISV